VNLKLEGTTSLSEYLSRKDMKVLAYGGGEKLGDVVSLLFKVMSKSPAKISIVSKGKLQKIKFLYQSAP
jgi:hypothetical protein